MFHSWPPAVFGDELGGFGYSWVAGCWRVVVQGNHPPPKWEVVHNAQAVPIPGEVTDLSEGKGSRPSVEVSW